MSFARFTGLVVACWLLSGLQPAWAQSGDDFDPSWYDADAPYVQIDVAADGVYRVSGSTLREALPNGTSLSDISPETIQLFEYGEEIPIQITGAADGRLEDDDTITFVGHRNRGTDEHWAYNYSRGYDQRAQSSTYYSLYSDTTTYWMTWGDESGRRYDTPTPTSTTPTSALRDTLHAERDNRYYFGRPFENGNAKYTFSEGYFWTRLSHNDTSPQTFTHTLPVDRRTSSTDELELSFRLDSGTNSCHRVELEAELQSGFQSLRTVEWSGYERKTLTASISQANIPADGLTLRLTSYNDNFSDDNCPDPADNPNYVLVDWIEGVYTRSLEATNNTQRFVAPTDQNYTFNLSGYTSNTVHVYNPQEGHRYEASVTNGTATVTDAPGTAPTPYWAVGNGTFRTPAAVRADQPSNPDNDNINDWVDSDTTDSDNLNADYLILTTEALLPSAKKLAEYRRTTDNLLTEDPNDTYTVEIALVQNVFDEFDYARPTPIAIRRFVRATQDWKEAPDFLTIFADAQYPIRDGSVSTLYPEWSVPAFGYSPSDGWFAMQGEGPDDWSEVLAVGRIPVRSVAQGDLFIEKLKRYEAAPLKRWQKRMLLLAGGTSQGEQDRLQDYSNQWGEIASDTVANTNGYSGPGYTGMDTIRYYKKVDDALDASFQDSLSVDLKRGAGWLSYFGHSAAQTWEIVTDPPSDFDNAGRLPVVVSLGCRTGSFAGGRFEEKSAPSLGEQLVVGSVRSDGTPRDGALNGGIAHFGESALGNRLPSARINDALIQGVFVDTMRVLGEAIRAGKADIAARFGSSDFYVKHLLQYGLLGDPATNLALPDQPDLHVDPSLISISPTAPTLSDNLTVSVEVQSRGLIPDDSVDVRLTWERPNGSAVRRTRRLQRFPLRRTLEFSFSLDERTLGTNTFRVNVDPDDEYEENNETDNVAQKTQVVFDTGVSLISPVEFGTVSNNRPSLDFSVSRRSANSVPVVLQLDSLPDFSSPSRQETQKEVDDLKATWRPAALSDNTTYYWRARIADADQDTWRSGRFTVTSSLPQSSWLQKGRLFAANGFNQLTRSNRRWGFKEFPRNILMRSNLGNADRVNGFILDGTASYEYLRLGFGVLVMNATTGEVRDSKSFPTYDVSDRFEDLSEVGDQQEAVDSLAAFLDRVPREGDYVFVRTRHLARQSSASINDEVVSLFENLGTSAITDTPHSAAIDTLTYGDLWTMKAQKGNPEATVEKVRPDTNQMGQEERLRFPRPTGSTTTPRIGPVSEWSSLSWTGSTSDPDDVFDIDVLSADSTVLIDDLSGASGERPLDQIDAKKHPYLRLRATLTDSTNRTAPQLKKWSVSYEGVPELVADPAGLSSLPDTVQQGRELSLSIPVANIGSAPSKPIRVQYEITDASSSTRTFATDTLQALSAGKRDTSTARLSTSETPGLNVLTISVSAPGPPERIAPNNTIIRNVYVQKDRTAPTLTVLANGRELPSTPDPVNNFQSPSIPFVSTQPSFEITLQDDNPYLALSDTSRLQVYLKGGLPSDDPLPISDFQRIAYSSDQLSLISSDSSTSSELYARFEPSLPPTDSTYTIKVEATDTQGNQMEPYQASFRIQPDQVIKDVYPYPNPMSTQTTFAFLVKGGRNEMLGDFSIRIYTLSGRLVRELDRTDLDGPLSVGWNRLTWNGRDEDGDRVATGVYLYRVRIEGDDQTFRGDVEKVTVIR